MIDLFLLIYSFVCFANAILFTILVIEVTNYLKNQYPECKFTYSVLEFMGAIFTMILLFICPIIHLYTFYLLAIKANWVQKETIKNIENKYNLGGKNDGME